MFFTAYGIVSCKDGYTNIYVTICTSIFTGHYTICCKKPQSCAPEDGQKFARNMLSRSWRSIKLLLLHLVGFCITLPTLTVVAALCQH